VLELRDVSFAYPGGPRVVSNISLAVERGSRVGVMGENGCGKTTLAHLMCGLLHPADGEVLVDGLSTSDVHRIHDIRRRVGLVFQDPDDQLIETTVEREIGFGPRNLGLTLAQVESRVDRALGVFGIRHLRQRSCHLLSAGEKQTVTVASIFAMQPDYIVLDESTSLLDGEARLRLMGAVERLLSETGAGLVFISMRLEDAWSCDRVVFLKGGSVAFSGGKEDLPGWLLGQELPLTGLSLLLGSVEKIAPGFVHRVARGRDLSAGSLAAAIAEIGGRPEGGGACP
jgi:energy-coupling factor transporter ATP-binding protein EcfA2